MNLPSANAIEQEDISVSLLTDSIGARIDGVDFKQEITPVAAGIIREAFAKHHVLVFRNAAQATREDQERVASVFGEPQPLEVLQFLGATMPELFLRKSARVDKSDKANAAKASAMQREELVNIGIAGEADGWHTDSSFTPWLPKTAVLRAETMPPYGGDTAFSSLCAAYEALSPTMQRWCSELSLLHTPPGGYKEGINLKAYGKDAEARFDKAYPPREWPLVIRHPETGRKALFVNPGYSMHVVGLKRAESHNLLKFLYRHVSSAAFTYNHHWQLGDLVVWDEVFTLHRVPQDFDDHDRKVIRVTAGRQVPTSHGIGSD